MSGEFPVSGVHAVFPGRGNRDQDAAKQQQQKQQPQQRVPNYGGGGPVDPALSNMYAHTPLFPDVPKKIVIEDHSLVEVFRHSASFQKCLCYLQGCAESVFSTPFSLAKREAVVAELRVQYNGVDATTRSTAVLSVAGEAAPFSPAVTYFLTELFPFLNKLVDDIPLEDMAQQRFGNRAKREFHRQMESAIVPWTRKLVDALPAVRGRDILPYSYDASTNGYARRNPAPSPVAERTETEKQQLAAEIAAYIKDSFGNATRLDYGTGHELHFFIVMMICLEELGDKGGTLLVNPADREKNNFVPLPISRPDPVPNDGALARTKELRRQMVVYVFQEYLTFVRRLQKRYSLEPAGSHGVWGLDDYHHIPYIFGAAQLIGKETPRGEGTQSAVTGAAAGGAGHGAILTKYVCDKAKVKDFCDEFMYFQMIQWILDNKSGPFFEHSNMLYNISAVEHWFKTYGGMVKMYAAEVLSKFNVVQHLLFGHHLPWNTQRIGTRAEDVAPAKKTEAKLTENDKHFL